MKKIRQAIGTMLAAAMLAAAGAAGASPAQHDAAHWMTRAKVAGIIADNQKIVSPNGIQQQLKLHIDGIDQWLTIRGRDLRNPVLLVLHG
ncbi:MAG: alpha/beta hydrolase, partial [Pseudomonadota bacterium]|nr:alpha/beta hydrolase [Pseudomonadota bacterium]